MNLRNSQEYLSRYEQLLMELTRHELDGHAEFMEGTSGFRLKSCPFPGNIPLGLYELPKRSGEAHFYRLGHPLAEHVLAKALGRDLPPAEVSFDYTGNLVKVSVLELLVGKTGSLRLSLFTVESFDPAEDHLVFAGIADDGSPLDDDQARRLLGLPA